MKQHANNHPGTTAPRNAVLLALLLSVLAGCANNTAREPAPVLLDRPVGRFVLTGTGEDNIDLQQAESGRIVATTAAAGALGAPLIAAQVASMAGSTAVMTAVLPVLAPLAVVGLLAGAASGASQTADIRATHGAALDELNRKLAQTPLQHEADQAVARRLAEKFGDRFAGTARTAADTAFELSVRAVDAKVDRDANVVVTITARLRVLGLPANRELHEAVLSYATPLKQPAYLVETLDDELGRAWAQFADEIGAIVTGNRTGETLS